MIECLCPASLFVASGQMSGMARAGSRRSVLHTTGIAGLDAVFASKDAAAEDRPPVCKPGPSEALVLSCIDPRIIDQVHYYANVTSRLNCNYSQFTIAGAAVGVVAPKFRSWHQTFWENLAASIQLHEIKKVIAIDHRDCGAAKMAYPDVDFRDPVKEKQAHEQVMKAFRQEMIERRFRLEVVTLLMDLNGDVETLT